MCTIPIYYLGYPNLKFSSYQRNDTSSSSSYRATSTDIPDPLSPLLPVVHHFYQVLSGTSRMLTELLYVGSSWSHSFCEGVHRTSLMSLSLLLQRCLACLVRLTLIVFVMGGRWLYNCCFVGCCLQDLSNIARSIIVFLLSSFFSIRFVSVEVVHPYSSIDTTAT